MTAEIAIMNKTAVALAADSAVTMETVGKPKIYYTVNKLFALSKFEPVGVMIYGMAEFMDVPWESIIKMYRNHMGDRVFDSLRSYAQDFAGFLDNNRLLSPENVQKEYVFGSVSSYYTLMREEIKRNVEKIIATSGVVDDIQIERVTTETVEAHYKEWRDFHNLPSMPKSQARSLISKYNSEFLRARKEVLEELPVTERAWRQLKELSAYLFTKDHFAPVTSGVVVAGFGKGEIFPSLVSLRMEGVAGNKLKYKEDSFHKISSDNRAIIFPFADIETVRTFISGINPRFKTTVHNYMKEMFANYPRLIVESMTGIADDESQKLGRRLEEIAEEQFDFYASRMEQYERSEFVDPIIEAVTVQPKDELASMAEALVSLTSFRQKVSLDTETVGGEVDVAVISKGDGFIWIKRKHYFKPELNARFFANYYPSVPSDK